MIAVILAGGKGTRFAKVARNIPKPLVTICGKPALQYQIENLRRCGINKVLIVIEHQGHKIKEFFGNGSAFGVQIDYYQEENPLGTAGALYYIKEKLSEDFLLLYGDLIFDLDLTKFIAFHKKNKAFCSLMVHSNNHPYDSDIMVLDDKGIVTKVLRKNVPREEYYSNTVNAGIFLLNKWTLKNLQEAKKQDLEEDLISPLIPNKRVAGYRTTEYIGDFGTPERYEKVQKHLLAGIVAQRSMNNKQKAIFLDRDGTINKDVGFVARCDDLEVKKEVYSAIRMINDSEYLAIVITNQSVVARNLCSVAELNEIHYKMEVELGQRSAYIDDLFYCPHHPDRGYPEENANYKIKCDCRKPRIGLIEQAAKKYNIDLAASYFIGDSMVDVQTGKSASVKTIFLGKPGPSHDKLRPDYYAKDLLDAVKIVVQPL